MKKIFSVILLSIGLGALPACTDQNTSVVKLVATVSDASGKLVSKGTVLNLCYSLQIVNNAANPGIDQGPTAQTLTGCVPSKAGAQGTLIHYFIYNGNPFDGQVAGGKNFDNRPTLATSSSSFTLSQNGQAIQGQVIESDVAPAESELASARSTDPAAVTTFGTAVMSPDSIELYADVFVMTFQLPSAPIDPIPLPLLAN